MPRLLLVLCLQDVSPKDALSNDVQVEADYGFNDEGDGEDGAGGEEGEQQAAGELQAGDVGAGNRGSEAQEGSGRAADAPADQDWPGFSADAPAVQPEPVQEAPASSAQHAQHAHQSSIEGLPGNLKGH